MAGSKDRSVVAVISGLTNRQAAEISKDIVRAKDKHAPFSRGTIATGAKNSVDSFDDICFFRIYNDVAIRC